ncbi:hypothetical protein GGI03_001765 [Coemansia sp. RSA 2337]|nr:hypothetical protein GGI03_001765 [Coemansia sp. RSA 2337]
MQNLSLFQLPPHHVVQMVVNHLVGSSRLISARVTPKTEEHKLLLLPLMQVSQNFWVIASVSFYRANTVKFCGSSYHDNEVTEYHWTHRLRKFYRNTHHLAQEVRIILDKPGVFYGQVLDGLSKRIKQMAPMVREIEVECGEIYVDKYPETEYFKKLLVRLFQLTPRVVHRIRDEAAPVDLLADGIFNLVHIDIESRNIDPIAQMARQSAMTLQYLAIETRGNGDAMGLIRDADGGYTEYPRLRVLKLEHYSGKFMDGKPVFPDAAPFSSLRVLRMSDYPFGNDVVFRGNAATLEYLDLEADSEIMEMFKERSLFTPTSHPKLQYVKFECDLGSAPYLFATDTAYFQFLLNVGSSAAVRGFSRIHSASRISAALSLLGDYPSIQVLCLPDAFLSLWDAITIIKLLPYLSDLHSALPVLGMPPSKVAEDELPAYTIAKYTQMSKRFRCWHLTLISETPFKEAINCVLLLALICSNFDLCDPPKDVYNRGFMDQLEKAIDLDGFKRYALRLRRLLFTK